MQLITLIYFDALQRLISVPVFCPKIPFMTEEQIVASHGLSKLYRSDELMPTSILVEPHRIQTVKTFDHGVAVSSLAASEKDLFAEFEEGEIEHWDMKMGKLTRVLQDGENEDEIASLAVTEGGLSLQALILWSEG